MRTKIGLHHPCSICLILSYSNLVELCQIPHNAFAVTQTVPPTNQDLDFDPLKNVAKTKVSRIPQVIHAVMAPNFQELLQLHIFKDLPKVFVQRKCQCFFFKRTKCCYSKARTSYYIDFKRREYSKYTQMKIGLESLS